MLNRLRRHRWLWALALVVLSFKLVAGTICLNDSVANRHTAPATETAVATNVANTATPSGLVDDSDNGTCLLGEAGGCHCACPETLPVPAMLTLDFGPTESRFVFRTPAYPFLPARAGPLLRPPIA